MAFDFNPITGNLDLVDSPAGYINGVVDDPTQLPVTLGTPPLDAVYLSKGASGLWLINRKPAGLYVRVANNGVAADWTYLGAFPEVNADGNWELYNSTDPTKELKFDLSGLPTGTTRTVTGPAGNGQMMVSGQAGSFTTLAANNGTLTASAPVLDLAQTWNNAAVTFTGLRFNVTNTASASTSDLVDIQIGGTTQLRLRGNQLFVGQFTNSGIYSPAPSYIGSTAGLLCATQLSIGNNLDTILIRDGASGVLAQRNGAVAQTFNIYNTFTSSTNHERGFLRWSSNVFQIGTEKGSGSPGGTARPLEFQTDGVTRMTIASAGNVTVGSSTFRQDGLITAGLAFIVGTSVSINANDLRLRSALPIQWSSTSSMDGTADLLLRRDAAGVLAQYNGSNAQAYRLYNTSSSGNANFERLNIRWASNECIIDAEAGGTGTSLRGIKLGSATSSLLGFYGVTPVDQPATVADPAGGGTVDTEARTAVNAIIDRLQELGLIA